VSDLDVTVNFTPTNPYAGWFLNVSGTGSRNYGATSIDNIIIVDANEGTFIQGAGDSYSEDYQLLTAELSETVSITVSLYDGVLDGENSTSYTTSDNVAYQVELRWEDNGELAILDLGDHDFEVKFWWDVDNVKESAWQTITDNVENFIFDTGGENVFLARLRDNNPVSYWRSRVPLEPGGTLEFLIPAEDDNVYKYSFTLVDYTTRFYDGWVRLYREAGPVSEEWWDASQISYAYLIYQEFYKVRLFGDDGEEYEIQHFQAEDDLTPEPWQAIFYTDVENIVFKYDVISVLALRDNNGYIDAQWTGDADTTLVTINVYGQYRETLHATAQYVTPTSILFEWTTSDNDNIYWVEVETQHSTHGTWSDWFPISATISGAAAASGLGWGFPLAMATFAGFGAIAVFAMLWTKEHSNIAPVALMLMVIFLKLSSTLIGLQLMPVADIAIGSLFLLALIWAIAEALD
jgi:hypothetical protein